MKYLLDTNVFIWFVDGDNQLSSIARAHIEDDESELFISIVSLWEIVIKQKLGKLDFEATIQQMVLDIDTMDANLLGVEPRHLQSLESLPSYKNHKDPFDRLLISQAVADGLSIISSDGKFSNHSTNLVW